VLRSSRQVVDKFPGCLDADREEQVCYGIAVDGIGRHGSSTLGDILQASRRAPAVARDGRDTIALARSNSP
jgi:hypothetical protein